MTTCRNCDKPIPRHAMYCSTLCADMDKHPAPRDDMEAMTASKQRHPSSGLWKATR